MSRSRHNFINKIKQKKPKSKDGTNDDVIGMTKVFLKKEKEEATKPLGKNANVDLTSDEALNLMIDLSKGGGKLKKKKKKHSPPRKRTSVKPKRKEHIPFERTRKLMEQDPDVSEFYIPGPIPSFEEQQQNEESLHQYIDQERQNRKAEAEAEYEHLRQEAMRQFKEEAMRQFKEASAEELDFIPIAKGKKAQKKKKGGRRKTRRKRRTRRKKRSRRKRKTRRRKKN